MGILEEKMIRLGTKINQVSKANGISVGLTRQSCSSVLNVRSGESLLTIKTLRANWDEIRTSPCCEPLTNIELNAEPLVDKIQSTGKITDAPKLPNIFKFPQYSLQTTPSTWVLIVAHPPLSKKYNSYSIRIETMKTQGNGWDCSIGITTEKFERNDGTALVGYNHHSWGLLATGQKMYNVETKPYGQKLNEGDIVTIYLNYSTCELEFFVNGDSLGVAFENIPLHKPIYPAIASICSDFKFTME